MTFPQALAAGVRWANMMNKAGHEVVPSRTSVSAAMTDFSADYENGNFEVDLIDGGGNVSWPLSFVSFLTISRNITAYDCTNDEELLNWLAWVLTNDAYGPFHNDDDG